MGRLLGWLAAWLIAIFFLKILGIAGGDAANHPKRTSFIAAFFVVNIFLQGVGVIFPLLLIFFFLGIIVWIVQIFFAGFKRSPSAFFLITIALLIIGVVAWNEFLHGKNIDTMRIFSDFVQFAFFSITPKAWAVYWGMVLFFWLSLVAIGLSFTHHPKPSQAMLLVFVVIISVVWIKDHGGIAAEYKQFKYHLLELDLMHKNMM